MNSGACHRDIELGKAKMAQKDKAAAAVAEMGAITPFAKEGAIAWRKGIARHLNPYEFEYSKPTIDWDTGWLSAETAII